MTDPVLVYDGDCRMCTSSVVWLRAHLVRPVEIRSYQEIGEPGLDALGLTLEQVQAAAWWVAAPPGAGPETTLRESGHRAVGGALVSCRGWWRHLGPVVLAGPLRPIMAVTYRVVARNRHRLPGSLACRVGD